jgi:hypothetical protein
MEEVVATACGLEGASELVPGAAGGVVDPACWAGVETRRESILEEWQQTEETEFPGRSCRHPQLQEGNLRGETRWKSRT